MAERIGLTRERIRQLEKHALAELRNPRRTQDLLANLDRPLPDLDVVLLAHHLPDTKVFEIAGCHLTELCPGNPLAFSVAGQGTGAPFTALRILTSMRRTEDLRDGAIVILDQSSLPYPDPDGDADVPDRAVLLCTDP
ncbi:sigma factor-like helix-turn-helix DNA-binding protein, partial [Kibdelosporangium lantanae]